MPSRLPITLPNGRGNPRINKEKVKKILDKGDKKFLNTYDSEILKLPCRHLLIGASETGKSFAVCQFLMAEKNPYVYPYGKPIFIIHPVSKDQVKLENLKRYLEDKVDLSVDPEYKPFTITVSANIDNNVGDIMKMVKECEEKHLNFLLVIDDAYGTDTVNSNFIVELYVKGRHKNISVMFLTQVALSNKIMKDMRRNINYLWVFQSYEEDIDTMVKQLMSKRAPEKQDDFFHKYQEVTSHPYGYMVYSPFIKKNQFRFDAFFEDHMEPKSDEQIAKDIDEMNKDSDEEKDEKVKRGNPFAIVDKDFLDQKSEDADSDEIYEDDVKRLKRLVKTFQKLVKTSKGQ